MPVEFNPPLSYVSIYSNYFTPFLTRVQLALHSTMRQKRILRIELSRGRGGSVYVSVSPSDCVLSIKHELETLTGIPTLSQTLYYAATQLSDTTPLHEFCHTAPVPTLSLHVPIRGGASRQTTGFQPFIFKDVTKEECFEKAKLGNSNTFYLIVQKGLNFQAICANQYCQSVRHGNVVYISKGMYPDQGGYVSIRREVFRLKCPACNANIPAENWQNIVFTDCTANIEWILVDKSEGTTKLVTEKGMFTRAKASVGMLEYHALDVTLK